MLRLRELRLPLDHTENDLKKAILRTLKIAPERLLSHKVHRQGIDARQKGRPCLVYTVDFNINGEDDLLVRLPGNVTPVVDVPYEYPASTSVTSRRVAIVGTGPAGLFAGLLLARAGGRPLFLERGRPLNERVRDVERFLSGDALNTESNIHFGEGGAGTFSDGKLNTGIGDARCRKVLEEFVAAGAPPDILTKAKPHVGTDHIRRVVIHLRRAIEAMGGEFRFGQKVMALCVRNGRLEGLKTSGSGDIACEAALLAVGNAARDTFEMLHASGVRLESKPFSIGVRIEHPRELIDRALYGAFAGHPRLGAADYKMVHHGSKGYSAYTFCMCPGGMVVPSATEPGGVATNGMSEYARNRPNSNSGLMVGVSPKDFGSDHPLAGIAFQRQWEEKAYAAGGGGHRAPVQRVEDFLARRPSKRIGAVLPSYLPGVSPSDSRECLPDFVLGALSEALRAFDKRLKGFAYPDAVMTGVETRSSSPVRIWRDETFQTNILGLYPAGEGAGYAGGIVSSAVDGLRAAEALLSTLSVSRD